MSTKLYPADRRQQILEAALASFLDKGYGSTSIADIRARSGASTGSIYHFFSGKGALATALLGEAVDGWSAAASLDPAASAKEAIVASVRGLVLWALANPAQFRFMDEVRSLASSDPDLLGVRDLLAHGQAASAAQYDAFVAAGATRDLPWPVAYSLMLGPAYTYLRLAPQAAPYKPEQVATLLAEAAWRAVSA